MAEEIFPDWDNIPEDEKVSPEELEELDKAGNDAWDDALDDVNEKVKKAIDSENPGIPLSKLRENLNLKELHGSEVKVDVDEWNKKQKEIMESVAKTGLINAVTKCVELFGLSETLHIIADCFSVKSNA